MAKKKEQVYTVAKGCDTADGVRYEPGDPYDPANHKDSTTKELLDSGAIVNVDSQ